MYHVVLFAVVVAVTSAATCPQLPVTKNLDEAKFFQGKWLPIAQSMNVKYCGKCPVSQYTLSPRKEVKDCYITEDGIKVSRISPITVNATAAHFTMPNFLINDAPASCCAYTDYDTYYVSHNCLQLADGKILEYVLVSIRESHLPHAATILSSLKSTLSKAGSKANLVNINRDNCPH